MPQSLFIFAHQDDEYAAAPWIVEEMASYNNIACAYLTDGGARAQPEIRDRESTRALRSLGVPESRIGFLTVGSERVRDGELFRKPLEARDALEAWIERTEVDPARIYAPAYEGGHPDHDVAYAIAGSVATRRGKAEKCWHFALYNGYRCPKPFYSTLRQLPTQARSRRTILPIEARAQLAAFCRFYPSQWRTWLGLLPGATFERLLGRESVVQFEPARLRERPHPGPLLYERLFSTSYDTVAESMRPLVDELCVPSV